MSKENEQTIVQNEALSREAGQGLVWHGREAESL